MPKLLLIERNIVLVDSLKNGSYFFVRDVRQTPDNEFVGKEIIVFLIILRFDCFFNSNIRKGVFEFAFVT